MVLVDTSVLIGYMRGDENAAVKDFQFVLDNNVSFGICPVVYQEVLQGAKGERDFSEVKKYLDTQTMYLPNGGRESSAAAARIYFNCRRKGLTVGTIDCIVAQTAIEHGLYLLHNDSDFDRMGRLTGLRIFSV